MHAAGAFVAVKVGGEVFLRVGIAEGVFVGVGVAVEVMVAVTVGRTGKYRLVSGVRTLDKRQLTRIIWSLGIIKLAESSSRVSPGWIE